MDLLSSCLGDHRSNGRIIIPANYFHETGVSKLNFTKGKNWIGIVRKPYERYAIWSGSFIALSTWSAWFQVQEFVQCETLISENIVLQPSRSDKKSVYLPMLPQKQVKSVGINLFKIRIINNDDETWMKPLLLINSSKKPSKDFNRMDRNAIWE